MNECFKRATRNRELSATLLKIIGLFFTIIGKVKFVIVLCARASWVNKDFLSPVKIALLSSLVLDLRALDV